MLFRSSVPKPRRKKQAKRFAHRRNPAYAAWVREQYCLLGAFPGHTCVGIVQACHVKSRGSGGGDNSNLLALCAGAHHQQHSLGTTTFARKWGIDLKLIADCLYAAYLATREP